MGVCLAEDRDKWLLWTRHWTFGTLKLRKYHEICLKGPRKPTENFSEYFVFRLTFEPGTSRLQAYSACYCSRLIVTDACNVTMSDSFPWAFMASTGREGCLILKLSLNRYISWTLFIFMETQRVGIVLSWVVRNMYKAGLYMYVMSDIVSQLLCFCDVNMVIDGA